MYKTITNKEHSASHLSLVSKQNFEEVEELTLELERLLAKLQKSPDSAGIYRNVGLLERWLLAYRQGQATTHKILEAGMTLLADLRDRIKLAADEMQRLESEGGNPASKEQAERTDELLMIVRHIGIVRSHIERRFSLAEQEQQEEREKELTS